MTVCVALTHGSETWIASDGLSSCGWRAVQLRIVKWFDTGEWWASTAGWSLGRQMIEQRKEGFPSDPHAAAELWIEMLVRAGFKRDKEDGAGPPDLRQELILARNAQIITIDGTGLVTDAGNGDTNYLAIGSGSDEAHGSLYSTEHLDPKRRVNLAVRAAIRFDLDCGGRIWYKNITE